MPALFVSVRALDAGRAPLGPLDRPGRPSTLGVAVELAPWDEASLRPGEKRVLHFSRALPAAPWPYATASLQLPPRSGGVGRCCFVTEETCRAVLGALGKRTLLVDEAAFELLEAQSKQHPEGAARTTLLPIADHELSTHVLGFLAEDGRARAAAVSRGFAAAAIAAATQVRRTEETEAALGREGGPSLCGELRALQSLHSTGPVPLLSLAASAARAPEMRVLLELGAPVPGAPALQAVFLSLLWDPTPRRLEAASVLAELHPALLPHAQFACRLPPAALRFLQQRGALTAKILAHVLLSMPMPAFAVPGGVPALEMFCELPAAQRQTDECRLLLRANCGRAALAAAAAVAAARALLAAGGGGRREEEDAVLASRMLREVLPACSSEDAAKIALLATGSRMGAVGAVVCGCLVGHGAVVTRRALERLPGAADGAVWGMRRAAGLGGADDALVGELCARLRTPAQRARGAAAALRGLCTRAQQPAELERSLAAARQLLLPAAHMPSGDAWPLFAGALRTVATRSPPTMCPDATTEWLWTGLTAGGGADTGGPDDETFEQVARFTSSRWALGARARGSRARAATVYAAVPPATRRRPTHRKHAVRGTIRGLCTPGSARTDGELEAYIAATLGRGGVAECVSCEWGFPALLTGGWLCRATSPSLDQLFPLLAAAASPQQLELCLRNGLRPPRSSRGFAAEGPLGCLARALGQRVCVRVLLDSLADAEHACAARQGVLLRLVMRADDPRAVGTRRRVAQAVARAVARAVAAAAAGPRGAWPLMDVLLEELLPQAVAPLARPAVVPREVCDAVFFGDETQNRRSIRALCAPGCDSAWAPTSQHVLVAFSRTEGFFPAAALLSRVPSGGLQDGFVDDVLAMFLDRWKLDWAPSPDPPAADATERREWEDEWWDGQWAFIDAVLGREDAAAQRALAYRRLLLHPVFRVEDARALAAGLSRVWVDVSPCQLLDWLLGLHEQPELATRAWENVRAFDTSGVDLTAQPCASAGPGEWGRCSEWAEAVRRQCTRCLFRLLEASDVGGEREQAVQQCASTGFADGVRACIAAAQHRQGHTMIGPVGRALAASSARSPECWEAAWLGPAVFTPVAAGNEFFDALPRQHPFPGTCSRAAVLFATARPEPADPLRWFKRLVEGGAAWRAEIAAAVPPVVAASSLRGGLQSARTLALFAREYLLQGSKFDPGSRAPLAGAPWAPLPVAARGHAQEAMWLVAVAIAREFRAEEAIGFTRPLRLLHEAAGHSTAMLRTVLEAVAANVGRHRAACSGYGVGGLCPWQVAAVCGLPDSAALLLPDAMDASRTTQLPRALAAEPLCGLDRMQLSAVGSSAASWCALDGWRLAVDASCAHAHGRTLAHYAATNRDRGVLDEILAYRPALLRARTWPEGHTPADWCAAVARTEPPVAAGSRAGSRRRPRRRRPNQIGR